MFFKGRGCHDAAKIGPKSGNLISRWRQEALLKRGWRLPAVSTRIVESAFIDPPARSSRKLCLLGLQFQSSRKSFSEVLAALTYYIV